MSDVQKGQKTDLMEFYGGPADGMSFPVERGVETVYLAVPERLPVWKWGEPFTAAAVQELTIHRLRYDLRGPDDREYFDYTGGFE